jgi:transposase InsO family protein
VSHANAPMNPPGRLMMVRRIAAGRPVAHVAAEMGVSRTTAWKWWRRYLAEGASGLVDRSSVAHRHPHRTPACIETRVRIARMLSRRGPIWIGHHLGLPASTVGRILARHQVPRLTDCDPLTGQPIRAQRRSANRYEHPYPGSLVHIDVKKLGRIPDGGGWKAHGRPARVADRHKVIPIGYDYVHTAIDDHSRLAYAEIHDDEFGITATAVLRRAVAWFAARGVTARRVLTDNGGCYRSRDWAAACAQLGITPKRTRPYRPQTNGKVERFNRTMTGEWAFAQLFTSEADRRAAFPGWLHAYNHHRPHTGIGGHPPISRLTNLSGQYN